MNKKLITGVATIFLILGILFIINQTVQFYAACQQISIVFADVVLGILLISYLGIIYYSFGIFFRLRATKKIGELSDLKKILKNNKLLKDYGSISTDESLKVLEKKAVEIIKKYAGQTFITTAVSQSGKLDGLFVLVNQIRMIKEIAYVYNQRPTLTDLTKLYANVGATTFLAVQIEDAELEEFIEPIVGNIFSTSVSSVLPGINIASSFLVNSILDGTINAYLTLRIGLTAKQYSDYNPLPEKTVIRKTATVEAGKLLSEIVVSSGKKVATIIYDKTKDKAVSGLSSMKDKIKSKTEDFFSKKK